MNGAIRNAKTKMTTAITPQVALHPIWEIRNANGIGSAIPAEDMPMVEKANARPRRRTNHLETVASAVMSLMATAPKARTKPYPTNRCH